MDTNKMREQFIDWLKTQPHVLNVGFNESTGKFVLAEDETAWQAWQASREAVVVDIEPDEPADEGAAYLHEDFVRSRIEAQGLKVTS